ncbi:hypothetical protein DFH11DRAFT_1729676 [Phellopilus nigrolimitatus]|nr:hypothetical protein DFH11DRAFT_1729676 [Phellopilus nigrolimitatus]
MSPHKPIPSTHCQFAVFRTARAAAAAVRAVGRSPGSAAGRVNGWTREVIAGMWIAGDRREGRPPRPGPAPLEDSRANARHGSARCGLEGSPTARQRRDETQDRWCRAEIDPLLLLRTCSGGASGERRRAVLPALGGSVRPPGENSWRRHFQLAYARNAWQEERASWRAVVQLNLLRSVNLILDVLQSALAGAGSGASSSAYLLDDVDDDDATPPPPPAAGLALSETHKLLRLRLAPLRRVQADLERRLGSGAEEPVSVAGGPPTVAAPFDASGAARRPQEFYVRSSTGWKSALDRLRPRSSSAGSREEAQERARRERDAEESTAIIAGCCDALWTDSVVRHCQIYPNPIDPHNAPSSQSSNVRLALVHGAFANFRA